MLDSAWFKLVKIGFNQFSFNQFGFNQFWGAGVCGGSKDSDENLRQYIVNARFSILCG